LHAEIRRHYYPSDRAPKLKVKIKIAGQPKDEWVAWYRVFKDGVPLGWRPKKPDDYMAIAYVTAALDPFDAELNADVLLWPEGEKDVDTLSRLNLPAFTFGGVGDGLPNGISHFFKDRRLVILADNDKPGREHAEEKARVAHEAGATTIRIVHFSELPPKGDVSDFVANGGTAEQLKARSEAVKTWSPGSSAEGVEGGEASAHLAEREIGRELVVRRADEIAARAVEWLWPGRIARGKLTLFGGDPGLGKSQVLLFIAATFSNGGYWPCDEGRAPRGHVIILSAEDGEDDTIKPRLMAAGADCSKVHMVSAVREGGDRKMFNLQRDLDLLEKLISNLAGPVVAVVIDPLTAYLGPVDSHKTAEMRAVLGPIAELAARLNVAFIGNTHLNKSTEQVKALYRFIGSIATAAAARAAFAVVEDRDDPARRLLVHAKNNLAAAPAGLAFRLEQHVVEDGIVTSAVAWESEHVDHTADSALNFSGEHAPTAKDDAIEFLQRILAAGPLAVREVEREARDCGLLGEKAPIGQCKPLRMARKALGVDVEKAGMQGGWVWSLPQSLDRASPHDVNEDVEASPSPKMPFEVEGAQTKDWAPSGSEGTFEAKFDGSTAGFRGHKEAPDAPSWPGEPKDDLSIPEFLRRTANGAR
jgi:putative DNA primase/helicase